jgi:hypothetical protein
MFCPNCASPNNETHSFCRKCGLKLDEVKRAVAEQYPSIEYERMKRRVERLERNGAAVLVAAGITGFALLVLRFFLHDLVPLHPDVVIYAFVGIIIPLGLFAAVAFGYRRIVDLEKLKPQIPSPSGSTQSTNKLLGDPVFEPASVSEYSTQLLERRAGEE